mmetsp:Transcript_26976/g.52073  ORF Transcript_26976/g.52073 Transcript_26976/m.52073 type:complete len:804 (+) Transcript_26976:66-2477(+)
MASYRSNWGVPEETEPYPDFKQAIASADPPEPLELVCRFAPMDGLADEKGSDARTGTGGPQPQELQPPPTNLVSSGFSTAQSTNLRSVDTHQEKVHVAQWVDTYGIPQKLMDWQPLESPVHSGRYSDPVHSGRYSDGAAKKTTSVGRSTPGSLVDFTNGFRETASGISTPGGALLTWRSHLGNPPHLQQQQMLSDTMGSGNWTQSSVHSDHALLSCRASQQRRVLGGSKSATSTGWSDSSQIWAARAGFRLPTPPRSRFESSVGSPGPSGYSTPTSAGAAIRAHPQIQQEQEAAAAAQAAAVAEIEASTRGDSEAKGAGALLSFVVSHPLQVIGISGLVLLAILLIPQISRTPQASLTFDCEVRNPAELPVWSQRQRRWCCEHKKAGCEDTGDKVALAVTSKAPRSSSTSAVPVISSRMPVFNCQGGLWNWKRWPKEQLTWCCKHQLRFCPGTGRTTITAVAVDGHNCEDGDQLTWDAVKSAWCCDHHSVGCDESSNGIDCQLGIASWEDSWTPAKKVWCCQRFKVGCGSNARPSAYDCQTRRGNLSAADAEWCCQHYPVACNRGNSMTIRGRVQEPYNCTRGSQIDEQQWPLKRRFWCCWHHKVGCLTRKDGEDKEQLAVQMQETTFSCSDLSSISSLEQRAWCCSNRAVGCSTTTAFATRAREPQLYICNVGIETCTATWTNRKRIWCRQHKGITCQLTTQAPGLLLDCNNMTRSWTLDERKLCCDHQPELCGSEQLFNQWTSRTSSKMLHDQNILRYVTGGALVLLTPFCLVVLTSKLYSVVTNQRCRGYKPVPDESYMI